MCIARALSKTFPGLGGKRRVGSSSVSHITSAANSDFIGSSARNTQVYGNGLTRFFISSGSAATVMVYVGGDIHRALSRKFIGEDVVCALRVNVGLRQGLCIYDRTIGSLRMGVRRIAAPIAISKTRSIEPTHFV